jgi:MarR family transcriptional regulator, temperature-dependent positive regulator of motility
MKNNLEQDQFELLRKIYKSPDSSQRDLAFDLGFSLGKLNYCLKELKIKGLVKIKNFQSQKNKISHLRYMLTTKGVSFRTRLTIDFMKRKMQEYDQLKKELEDNSVDNN